MDYKPIVESVDGRGVIVFVFDETKDSRVKDFVKGTVFEAKDKLWKVIGPERPWYHIDKTLRKREDELRAFYVKEIKL